MSKIGRRPIDLRSVQVEVHGRDVVFKGKKASGTHVLPLELQAEISDKSLKIYA